MIHPGILGAFFSLPDNAQDKKSERKFLTRKIINYSSVNSNTCSLLINHSHHSIPRLRLPHNDVMTTGWTILQRRESFCRIFERAQRQSCYSIPRVPGIPRERGSRPKNVEDESLLSEESCSYVIERLSRRWSPARPLFMNIFHRRNFLLCNVSRSIIVRKVANNRCVEPAKTRIRVALPTDSLLRYLPQWQR